MADAQPTAAKAPAAAPGKAAAPAEEKAKKPGKPMFVQAKLNGDYRGLRRAGARFWLQDSNLFSKKWMEKADPSEEEKAEQAAALAADELTAQVEDLKRENAQLKAELSALKSK